MSATNCPDCGRPWAWSNTVVLHADTDPPKFCHRINHGREHAGCPERDWRQEALNAKAVVRELTGALESLTPDEHTGVGPEESACSDDCVRENGEEVTHRPDLRHHEDDDRCGDSSCLRCLGLRAMELGR